MESSTPPIPPPPTDLTSGVAREIRHAVYLTGGLVLLALGVMDISSELGVVVGCTSQRNYCPGGSLGAWVAQTGPTLIGAGVLTVIAIVLLLMARNTLRRN